MYSMWRMLQRFCLMVKLMYQKLEKVAKLFTISVLLLNVSYLTNTIKCVFWRTSIFQPQANLSFSTVPRRTLSAYLFEVQKQNWIVVFIWESSFSPKTEIIPNNWNALGSIPLQDFSQTFLIQKFERDCWWLVDVDGRRRSIEYHFQLQSPQNIYSFVDKIWFLSSFVKNLYSAQ